MLYERAALCAAIVNAVVALYRTLVACYSTVVAPSTAL